MTTSNKPNDLLGRRVRALRKARGLSQQALGEKAEVNYKFLGEIERGQQNPSFKVLVKIANALEVELPELFRFEGEVLDRKDIEKQIAKIVSAISEEELRQVFLLLRVLYPVR